MVTFSIRTLLLFTAAIATIYPIVRPPSAIAFVVSLILGCVTWAAAGISLRIRNSHRWYFAALGIVPILIAVADNLIVAVCDGWPTVTINLSLPEDVDPPTATLHYVALHKREMLPLVLKHGVRTLEAVPVSDMTQPLKLRTGYSYRCSRFGNTFDDACEYDIVVFLATASDGKMRHGVVELPNRYDPRPFSIRWEDATEQSREPERRSQAD